MLAPSSTAVAHPFPHTWHSWRQSSAPPRPSRATPALPILFAALVTATVGCLDGEQVRTCSEGEVAECACGARTGEQQCQSDATFGACECAGDGGAAGGDGECTEGETAGCDCFDGRGGDRTCQASGAYGPCDCDGPGDGPGPMPDAGRCTDTADSDADGLLDCLETGDEDSWTDADVFNGVRVTLRPGCGAADFQGGCDVLLNAQQVGTCTAVAASESTQQYAGWDFGPADSGDSCSDAYGFEPAWTACEDPFQVLADGLIQLETGRHCFFVSDGHTGGCGAMYLSRSTADEFVDWANAEKVVVRSAPGGDITCAPLDAGVYPIRWFFNMWGQDQAFRLRYCFGGSDDCAPGRAIPSGMLRPGGP